MLIAGEASGDMLAAELVEALRKDSETRQEPFAPRFMGAGGATMAGVGGELAFDMTPHAVVGLAEALRHYVKFRRLLYQLMDLAFERRPDVIVLVDFSGFNRRFAHALRNRLRAERGLFHNWYPRIVQYVSPQVWASRPGRADSMARDMDLLLCLFPFEKDWYARRIPGFRVEFVGHPLVDRLLLRNGGCDAWDPAAGAVEQPPLVLLLPGSRKGELKRHLPVMLPAARLISERCSARFRLVLPNDELVELARRYGSSSLPGLETIVGGLARSLAEATLAVASTGTVTLECAFSGLPAVTLYKTSWGTYQVGRRVVTVKHLAMPNLLANETIYPEFIQDAATPEALAGAAVDLLLDPIRSDQVRAKLLGVAKSLGEPGASLRAARAIGNLTANASPRHGG